MSQALIEVDNLKLYFPIRGGVMSRTVAQVHALDGVSLTIERGQTLALVGESGCGKTTLGRCMVRLLEPTEGSIMFDGVDLTKVKGSELRKLRGRMSMIFQDPMSSLNPKKTIADIVGQPLEIQGIASGRRKDRKVAELLEKVGIGSDQLYRYPHEFSGGQKQRIGIARAIATAPEFIVADEAVAALDASIKIGILNLMEALQKELGLTYLFISHDLSVVRYLCDKVAVMYLGKIVEFADTETIFANPVHPYTKALISAIPIPDPTVKRERIILTGSIPTPINPPSGCRFRTRCPYAIDRCSEEIPPLVEVGPGHDHYAACIRAGEI
jgi:oligopeptide/dipeptide ABC transporter ATP-binding protein